MGKKSRLKKQKRQAKAMEEGNPTEIPVNTSGILIDPGTSTRLIFTDDMLINQLRRDCPQIASSFDGLCEPELVRLSKVFSRSAQVICTGLMHHNGDRFFQRTGMLMMNAGSSFIAATHLLRSGFVLQPGMLVRTIVEQVATTLHLMAFPADLVRLTQGKFDSCKSITTANKMLPIFGRLYGLLSDGLTHVGELHTNLQPVRAFKDRQPSLEANLQFLGIAAVLIDMTTELLFLECVETPRYWKREGSGRYSFSPSQETLALIDSLVGETATNPSSTESPQ